jgi:hypothetical protein
MNAFLRNVEARRLVEHEERMATMTPPRAQRFDNPEAREAARKLRKKEREDDVTRRAQRIRAVNPALTGIEARVLAHRERAQDAREDARAAAEERMRLAAEVVRLVRDVGLTLSQVAARLGLEDDKAAYAEWKWATRRRGGL